MKNRRLFIIAVFLAVFSGTSWAIADTVAGSPMIRNPIGSGTVPPSTYSSGLVGSASPVDASSKYFRGIVPYRSTGSVLGTPYGEDFVPFLGGDVPYWPSSNIVTTRPGQSSVYGLSTKKVEDSVSDKSSLSFLPEEQILSVQDTTARPQDSRSGIWGPMVNVRFRPMSMTTRKPRTSLSVETGELTREGRLTTEQYQEEMERFQLSLEQLRQKADELERSLIERDDLSQLPVGSEVGEGILQPVEARLSEEQKSVDVDGSILPSTELRTGYNKTEVQIGAYEQIQQKIDELQRSYKKLLAARPSERVAREEEGLGREVPNYFMDLEIASGGAEAPRSYRKSQEGHLTVETPSLEELSQSELSAKAKDILGEHKTLDSFIGAKFEKYVKEAEAYLRGGKFYKAADAYTMASIYKPSEPLAYAGKSHALFAAGEYMSSALFLSRALEIFPEYARLKIDIVAIIGDRNKIESRIADVEKWVEGSDAGELQFLLGYVYYRLGRLELAKKAIDSAYEKMPGSPAVITLRKAIGEAILGR